MADQKNCSKGNVQCKGPSGIRCKSSCSTKLKNKTNIKQLDKLVNVINKAKDVKSDFAGKNALTKKAVGLLDNNTEDIVVNLAGNAGGIVGSAGGPVGTLVGDLVASTAMKHSILVKDSYDDLANTEEFDSLSPWQKANAVIKRAKQNDQKAKAAGEGTGFLVGNSVAEATKLIPGIRRLPLRGAIGAMMVMPVLQNQINKKLGVA